jgi:hypothetical protein
MFEMFSFGNQHMHVEHEDPTKYPDSIEIEDPELKDELEKLFIAETAIEDTKRRLEILQLEGDLMLKRMYYKLGIQYPHMRKKCCGLKEKDGLYFYVSYDHKQPDMGA